MYIWVAVWYDWDMRGQTSELWVEVPLRDGKMLYGMLQMRDAEWVSLRHAYWLYATQDGPVIEYVMTDRPWQDSVAIAADDVHGVFDVASGPDRQKWDIVTWPKKTRVAYRLWSKRSWQPHQIPLLHARTTEDALNAGWAED